MARRMRMAAVLALSIYGLGLQGTAAQSNSYPEGPVRILVGFPPGSGPDLVARTLAAKLSSSLGKPFVVENRTSARGNLALEAVARSEPNGHTILLATSAQMTINPALESSPDPLRELMPVTLATSNALLLLGTSKFAANSVQELIDLAKANPGKYSYASAGVGSEHHLAAELFGRRAGIKLVHIPYRGFPPAAADVISGNVEIAFGGVPPATALVKAGKLKALAVTSARRYPGLPNVPTFIESGMAGYEVYAWYGLLAPLKTPQPIIDKLNQAAVTALHTPDATKIYTGMGMDVIAAGPQGFAARINSDTRMWTQIIQAAGVKIQ
jgi:tripartite-type tricarboxylate transporter receptor subunit TctC